MTNTALAAAHVTPAIQDYLKTCYRLEQELNGPVPIGKVAQALDVAPPSATGMIKRMQETKLVRRDSEGRIALTPRGMSIALEVIRHHRLLETFLVNELGMDWAAAHEEAEVLEHYISERLEGLLDQRLARPVSDPHGEPIPHKDGTVALRRGRPLLDAPRDVKLIIEQVEAQSADLLHYLQTHGLVPGASIVLRSIEPFNGPVVLEVKKRLCPISREVAACLVRVRAGA